MEFDNSFDVPLAPAQAWAVLMDVPRIAPCMPGAELTDVVDAQNFKGKIAVRLGPVALAFAGKVELFDIDETNRTARVKAQGSDSKGRGSANAASTFRIEAVGAGSRVMIHTDLMLSGAVAQYGRGVGMIQATAAQIIGQFATNLRTQLTQQPSAAPTASAPPVQRAPSLPQSKVEAAAATTQPSSPLPPAAKPISGLALIARVIWQQIAGLFTGRRH
jgi:uncharacterized protein